MGPGGSPNFHRPRVISMTNSQQASRFDHRPFHRHRLGVRRIQRSAALTVAAVGLAAWTATTAQAGVLYGNFDPLAVTPDYSTTQYANVSGSCNGAIGCTWINVFSASFDFKAEASGTLSMAYLPMQATYSLPGAERIYGLTITNGAGEIVARGGFYGRDAPIGSLQVYEIELFGNTHAGQPVPSGLLADDPLEVVAGQTYTAHFAQTYGSMSGAQWMKSDDVPEPGQARVHCQTNVGGVCAEWNWGLNGWTYPIGMGYTAPMSDFLPALHLAGSPAHPPAQGVPAPSSVALLLAGGWAAWIQRPRRAKAVMR